MIHKLPKEKLNSGMRELWYMVAFFFLNRIVSTSIFGKSNILNEGFVLISEALTIMYFFK